MKETEKIEIMHFSQEGYLEDGKNVYETGKKMIELADKVRVGLVGYAREGRFTVYATPWRVAEGGEG